MKLVFASLLVLLLAGIADAATITLIWTDNSTDETGFSIERRLRSDPVANYKEIATTGANVTSADDATVLTNTQYCYRVRAFNPAAKSDYTNEACMMVTPSGLMVLFKTP